MAGRPGSILDEQLVISLILNQSNGQPFFSRRYYRLTNKIENSVQYDKVETNILKRAKNSNFKLYVLIVYQLLCLNVYHFWSYSMPLHEVSNTTFNLLRQKLETSLSVQLVNAQTCKSLYIATKILRMYLLFSHYFNYLQSHTTSQRKICSTKN